MTGAAPIQASEADRIISALGLAPHPEGGYYRETFRDSAPAPGLDGRGASTAIYYLLKAGEVSRWHRVDAAEIWHWYGGAPLELGLAETAHTARKVIVGPGVLAGEQPQAVVPAGVWQSARSLGAYTLVGCTVAPAFEFGGFEMAGPEFDPK
jgi:uncharacterized protein